MTPYEGRGPWTPGTCLIIARAGYVVNTCGEIGLPLLPKQPVSMLKIPFCIIRNPKQEFVAYIYVSLPHFSLFMLYCHHQTRRINKNSPKRPGKRMRSLEQGHWAAIERRKTVVIDPDRARLTDCLTALILGESRTGSMAGAYTGATMLSEDAARGPLPQN